MFMRLMVITGLFLLIIAAGGNFSLTEISARRAIPWDCTNWAAYAHEDRTTAILETLAENRGQTLYCGIDQSDTFTKAETWAAGRDRNERDNTIYWGERGNFRGFIAAQEGWLTEGESGITGQSTASIFEFPREKKKRRRYRWVTRQLELAQGDGPTAWGDFTTADHASAASFSQAYQWAQPVYNANRPTGFTDALRDASFQTRAETTAAEYCDSQGYQRTLDITVGDSSTEIWGYTGDRNNHPQGFNVRARKGRPWTATCEKRVRVRR